MASLLRAFPPRGMELRRQPKAEMCCLCLAPGSDPPRRSLRQERYRRHSYRAGSLESAKQCSRGEPQDRGTTISDYSTSIGAPEIAGNCVAAANDSQCLTPFRPIQMPVQKSKRALPVDRMSAIEV